MRFLSRRRRSMDKDKDKGLGDTVKRVIDAVTGGKRKPCGGCKKRQEALNRMMPYRSLSHYKPKPGDDEA